MPRVVIAVGGNSLTQSNQTGTIAEQYENAALTSRHIVGLLSAGWDVVLTHGNGPQVGNVLRRVELSRDKVYPLPLDICVADTQGGIGYMLQQVLDNELARRGISKEVLTIVTRTLVSADDPAFQNPTKPIGPFLTEAVARERMATGAQMREDAGRGWRRVVASPEPLEILELASIQSTVEQGFLVIACGGGGVPIIRKDGELHGVEAVVDKDRASSLLARSIGADLLLISTGVPHVQVRFGKPDAKALEEVTASELRAYHAEGQFPAGSMGPKVESVLKYLDAGGKQAIITDPAHIEAAVAGKAGTRIVP